MKTHLLAFNKVFFSFVMLLSTSVFGLIVTQDALNSLLLEGEKDAFTFPKRLPNQDLTREDLIFNKELTWQSSKALIFRTSGNIVFEENGKLICQHGCSLSLESGMEAGDLDVYSSTVVFKGHSQKVLIQGGGHVRIFYNPKEDESLTEEDRQSDHKFLHPKTVSYENMISPHTNVSTFMLINDVFDLHAMRMLPSGNYALGQNIDASLTQSWISEDYGPGEGFFPVGEEEHPFSGNFEGNGYTVSKLYINRPETNFVGLFGKTHGGFGHHSIKNLILRDVFIIGKDHVGTLVGSGQNTFVVNVKVSGELKGQSRVGGVIGSILGTNKDILYELSIDQEGGRELKVQGTSQDILESQKLLKHGKFIGACGGESCDCCSEDIGFCHDGTACSEGRLEFQKKFKEFNRELKSSLGIYNETAIFNALSEMLKCPPHCGPSIQEIQKTPHLFCQCK